METVQDSFGQPSMTMQQMAGYAAGVAMTQEKINEYYKDPEAYLQKYSRAGIVGLQQEAEAAGLRFTPVAIAGDAGRVFFNNLSMGLYGLVDKEAAEADKYQIGSAAKAAGYAGMAAGMILPMGVGAIAGRGMRAMRGVRAAAGSSLSRSEVSAALKAFKASGGRTLPSEAFLSRVEANLGGEAAERFIPSKMVAKVKGFWKNGMRETGGKTLSQLRLEELSAARDLKAAGGAAKAAKKAWTVDDKLRVMDKLEQAVVQGRMGRIASVGVGAAAGGALHGALTQASDERHMSGVERAVVAGRAAVGEGVQAGVSAAGGSLIAPMSYGARATTGLGLIGYGTLNDSPGMVIGGASMLIPGVRANKLTPAASAPETGPAQLLLEAGPGRPPQLPGSPRPLRLGAGQTPGALLAGPEAPLQLEAGPSGRQLLLGPGKPVSSQDATFMSALKKARMYMENGTTQTPAVRPGQDVLTGPMKPMRQALKSQVPQQNVGARQLKRAVRVGDIAGRIRDIAKQAKGGPLSAKAKTEVKKLRLELSVMKRNNAGTEMEAYIQSALKSLENIK